MKNKIKTQKEVVEIVKRERREGKKITVYSGSFDILHKGHVQALKEAKSQGDVLIILLNSDVSVKKYKGPNRPIVHERDRAEILSAIEYVDYIIYFDDIIPIKILEELKPDIFCQGRDWGKNCIEREVVERNGGKIHILKWEKQRSTSDIIKKIGNAHSTHVPRAIFLDRDGVINKRNEGGYIWRKKDFKFLPAAIRGLRTLSALPYTLIVVTNQAGIGKGLYSKSDTEKLNHWMVGLLQKKGIKIHKIYYCPHRPEDKCLCRKPGIGMFLSAVKDFGISLNESWFIGDDVRDVIAGRSANIQTIKLGIRMPKLLKLEPHFYAKDLAEAASIIMNHESR